MLSLLLLSVFRCLVLYKILDKASLILGIYLLATFITELLAAISIVVYKHNIVIYNIYSIVQYVLLCMYFTQIIDRLNKRQHRITIITIGIITYVINIILFQDARDTPSTNFLAFESITIVSMSLYYFYENLNIDNNSNNLNSHFWFNSILLIFWSFTLFYWLVGLTIYKSLGDKSILLNYMMWSINILTYTGFGLVFLFYKKLQPR